MSMISVEQIKAARAWMNWSQDELAQQSGLSLATIHNLEKGHLSARSLLEVRKTFEGKGFEFFGKDGFRRRKHEHRNYHGAEGTDEFFEDVLATLQTTGGEIAAIFPSQDTMLQSIGAVSAAGRLRLDQLARLASVKCLLSDVRQSILLPSVEFRCIPKHPYTPFSSVTYGNKVALVASDGVDFSYLVIASSIIAQNSFKSFNLEWQTAFPLLLGR